MTSYCKSWSSTIHPPLPKPNVRVVRSSYDEGQFTLVMLAGVEQLRRVQNNPGRTKHIPRSNPQVKHLSHRERPPRF